MTRALRTAAMSAVLGYRALFAWNTPGLFVTSLVLAPVVQLAFFVALGSSFGYADPAFFVVGNSIQAAAAAGVAGLVSVIADERRFGTLSVVLGAPTSPLPVFIGRLLPGVALGTFVSVTVGFAGLVAVGAAPSVQGALAYVVIAVVAAASCSALGLALSALGLVYRDIYQLATAAYLALLVFSGANIERADIHASVRWIGDLLPTTHAIDAARRVLSGEPLAAVLPELGLEVVIALAWTAIAVLGLRILAHRARVAARLDLY